MWIYWAKVGVALHYFFASGVVGLSAGLSGDNSGIGERLSAPVVARSVCSRSLVSAPASRKRVVQHHLFEGVTVVTQVDTYLDTFQIVTLHTY